MDITDKGTAKEEHRRYRVLFKAVIIRAFLDYHSRGKKLAAIREEAREWLESEDFLTICDLAACDSNVLYKHFTETPRQFKQAIPLFNIYDRGLDKDFRNKK